MLVNHTNHIAHGQQVSLWHGSSRFSGRYSFGSHSVPPTLPPGTLCRGFYTKNQGLISFDFATQLLIDLQLRIRSGLYSYISRLPLGASLPSGGPPLDKLTPAFFLEYLVEIN